MNLELLKINYDHLIAKAEALTDNGLELRGCEIRNILGGLLLTREQITEALTPEMFEEIASDALEYRNRIKHLTNNPQSLGLHEFVTEDTDPDLGELAHKSILR